MGLFAKVRNEMCRRMYVSKGDNITYSISHPDNMAYQMHSHTRMNVGCGSLLWNNVKMLNVCSKDIGMYWAKNELKLNNDMIYATVSIEYCQLGLSNQTYLQGPSMANHSHRLHWQ
jgi:hypothetical protein